MAASVHLLLRISSIFSKASQLRRPSSLHLHCHSLPHKPFSSSSSSSSSLCNKRNNLFSSSSETIPSPPLPKKIPFKITAHNTTWEDPYHWMSNTQDPDLSNHLKKENLYAEAFMANTKNLQRKLVSEMKSRMPPKISTPPERWGPWLYYQYIPEGKEYPVLCRRLESHNTGWVKTLVNYMGGGFGSPEILLDWNKIAEEFVRYDGKEQVFYDAILNPEDTPYIVLARQHVMAAAGHIMHAGLHR